VKAEINLPEGTENFFKALRDEQGLKSIAEAVEYVLPYGCSRVNALRNHSKNKKAGKVISVQERQRLAKEKAAKAKAEAKERAAKAKEEKPAKVAKAAAKGPLARKVKTAKAEKPAKEKAVKTKKIPVVKDTAAVPEGDVD
jgi:FKBP-type peptidyl-prolyl cis-trans isomerase